MTARRGLRVVALATIVGLLGACGVRAQSQPQEIAPGDVPFDLAERAPGATTSTTAVGTSSYELYFVANDVLRPVTRTSESRPPPRSVLQRLVAGPNDSEQEQGLRSVLAPDISVDDVVVDDGVATIVLGGGDASNSGAAGQALGVAQIVYTLTGLPGIREVRFVVDGRTSEVPRGDGTLSKQPVSRSDYPDAVL
jgi:spore germination protein GerM